MLEIIGPSLYFGLEAILTKLMAQLDSTDPCMCLKLFMKNSVNVCKSTFYSRFVLTDKQLFSALTFSGVFRHLPWLNHRGQKHISSFCDHFVTAHVLIRDFPPMFDLSSIIKLLTLHACSVIRGIPLTI